ncbi:MAG TPA: polyhydroxyalkanoic acid system family protein [Pirellulales bacterium]|jgi:hypothetical protein|nr:polyhydroxyalkanoic acid system family protein [Pirellulales bacterium]
MPSMKLAIPHQLSQEEATARLKNFLTKVKEHYASQVSDLQENWTDNALDFGFTTYGFKVSGQLQVEPSEVVVNGQIPFAAMMFKGKIEQSIRSELAKLLA